MRSCLIWATRSSCRSGVPAGTDSAEQAVRDDVGGRAQDPQRGERAGGVEAGQAAGGREARTQPRLRVQAQVVEVEVAEQPRRDARGLGP